MLRKRVMNGPPITQAGSSPAIGELPFQARCQKLKSKKLPKRDSSKSGRSGTMMMQRLRLNSGFSTTQVGNSQAIGTPLILARCLSLKSKIQVQLTQLGPEDNIPNQDPILSQATSRSVQAECLLALSVLAVSHLVHILEHSHLVPIPLEPSLQVRSLQDPSLRVISHQDTSQANLIIDLSV